MAGFVVLDISQEDYDKAIRAKAIDEFADFMADYIDTKGMQKLFDFPYTTMKEIAEELKQEGGSE